MLRQPTSPRPSELRYQRLVPWLPMRAVATELQSRRRWHPPRQRRPANCQIAVECPRGRHLSTAALKKRKTLLICVRSVAQAQAALQQCLAEQQSGMQSAMRKTHCGPWRVQLTGATHSLRDSSLSAGSAQWYTSQSRPSGPSTTTQAPGPTTCMTPTAKPGIVPVGRVANVSQDYASSPVQGFGINGGCLFERTSVAGTFIIEEHLKKRS